MAEPTTNGDSWLKLYRSITDSEVFADAELLKVWIWCLRKAAYKVEHVPVNEGRGKGIRTLQPGQFIWGRRTDGEKLGMAPSTAERRLKKLEDMGNVNRQVNHHYTVVTVCNWRRYQKAPPESEPQSEPAMNQQRTSNEPAMNTKKKLKKLKKSKKSTAAGAHAREGGDPSPAPATPPDELKDLSLYNSLEQYRNDDGDLRQRGQHLRKLWASWPEWFPAMGAAYPELDLAQEVRQAHAHEISLAKSKRKVDRKRYLQKWFARSQRFAAEKGGRRDDGKDVQLFI